MTDSLDNIVSAYWTHDGRVWAALDEASALAPSAGDLDHPDARECEWAVWEVHRMATAGSTDALTVVAALAAAAPSDGALGYLGAGPLEDLVDKHGAAFMDELVIATKLNPRLEVALATVRVDGRDGFSVDALKGYLSTRRR
jgi:hypothetical protein